MFSFPFSGKGLATCVRTTCSTENPPFFPCLWLCSSLNETILVQKNSMWAVYSEICLLHGTAWQPILVKPMGGGWVSRIAVFSRISFFISMQWSHHSWAVKEAAFMWIGLGMKFSRVFYHHWCLLKPRFILPSAHLHQNPSFLFYLCIFPESLSDCAVGVQGRGRMCARFSSAPVSQISWHPVSQDMLPGGESRVLEAVWFAERLWKVWASGP